MPDLAGVGRHRERLARRQAQAEIEACAAPGGIQVRVRGDGVAGGMAGDRDAQSQGGGENGVQLHVRILVKSERRKQNGPDKDPGRKTCGAENRSERRLQGPPIPVNPDIPSPFP